MGRPTDATLERCDWLQRWSVGARSARATIAREGAGHPWSWSRPQTAPAPARTAACRIENDARERAAVQNRPMPNREYIEALHRERDQRLLVLELAVPMLIRVDPTDAAQCRLWQACELCIYLDHRVPDPPDPYSLDAAGIAAWSARGLGPHERLSDPAVGGADQCYWLVRDDQLLGTIALDIPGDGWGWSRLTVASLYIFPTLRRQGHGRAVMAELAAACARLGLDGLWLSTHWVWQPTVRFYLDCGYAVQNWKHELRLCLRPADRPHRVVLGDGRVDLLIDGQPAPVLSASRNGDRLCWHEPLALQDAPFEDQHAWIKTFSLWLAVLGWPLIRDDATWAQRYNWSDAGMPEGLGYKIGVFEAYERHCGFPVHTPRIPGLPYPTWEDLQGPA